MSLAVAAQALALSCILHATSADGSMLIGPEHKVTLSGPSHSVLVRENAEIYLTGAEALGLASDWETGPNFHGSVLILPKQDGAPLSGLLVPNEGGTFSIFWANNERLKPNGAPITEVSGVCSPIIESDDREVVQ
ncbi:hypothetical protein [Pelagerythrobacter aerophilus]|uniref:hypothetical protein n=1 Tax=Pelagerythrobacter aerophilus TaxID=2306995 RepID=UPI0011C461D5|nr:hypothetical protein [Pelagerythrobacter aerophilus]